MKLGSMHTKIRPLLILLLSFLLSFTLYTPLWAYADSWESSEIDFEQEDDVVGNNQESSIEGELSPDVDSEQKKAAALEEEGFPPDNDEVSQATSVLPAFSPLATEAAEIVSPFAIGDIFTSTINVNNGGTITAIPCVYRVTDATPGNLQAQIGAGTFFAAAIPTATVGALIIPSNVTNSGTGETYSVTSIGTQAFDNCDSLTDTGLGTNSTVVSLENYAFYSCTVLTDTGLDTNSTISSLGVGVFAGCRLLGTVGTSSTNQGDLVLSPSIANIGANAFNGTAYERIYLLSPTSSDVAVGTHAFAFPGRQGTLLVPKSWDTGTSPITFTDIQYTYSDANGTLVVMYAPTIVPSIQDITRISGTADQARVMFGADTDSDFTIKDSTGATLWTGSALAGVLTTATLAGLSRDSLSGLTIEAAASLAYPVGATPRVYNTATGTRAEAFVVPAITYSIVFDGNSADNSDAMQVDAMSLTYGQTSILSTNAYTRSGYTFQGWNTVADGSGTFYADEGSVLNLTDVKDRTVTLYAQWIVPDPAPLPYPVSGSDPVSKNIPIALSRTADTQLPWMPLACGALIAASLSLTVLRRRAGQE